MVYLGINITKYVQYTYKDEENKVKTKWRHISCSWRRRFSIFHKSLPSLIYKVDAIKIPMNDFRDTQKLILNSFVKVENLKKLMKSCRIRCLEGGCCLALRLTAGLWTTRQCGSGDIIYKWEAGESLECSLLSQRPRSGSQHPHRTAHIHL